MTERLAERCVIHDAQKVTRLRQDGRRRCVCLQCEARRLRASRANGRKPEDPLKKKARKAVENAITRGHLARRACEHCGAEHAHAHHEDYTKPLDVKWLCPRHHKARHREIRNEKNAARLLQRAA